MKMKLLKKKLSFAKRDWEGLICIEYFLNWFYQFIRTDCYVLPLAFKLDLNQK